MNDLAFIAQFAASLSILVVPIVALVRLIAGADDALADVSRTRWPA